MCGGSDTLAPKPAVPSETYAAPDLKAVYQTFRDTGQVPYSYYGAGAPTNADELARVKAAYPGSFTTPPAPAPAQTPDWRQMMASGSPFFRLFGSMFGRNMPQK